MGMNVRWLKREMNIIFNSSNNFFFFIFSICYRLATIYSDEHNYEAAIKDLKEASAIDDRNLKVSIFRIKSIASFCFFFIRFK